MNGSSKKNAKFLLNRLKAMYGDDFDPIMKMAEIAADEGNDAQLRLQGWKELCGYIHPKLRSVEVSGDAENPLATSVKIELVRPEEWK